MKLVKARHDVLPVYGLPAYFIGLILLFWFPQIYVHLFWLLGLSVVPLVRLWRSAPVEVQPVMCFKRWFFLVVLGQFCLLAMYLGFLAGVGNTVGLFAEQLAFWLLAVVLVLAVLARFGRQPYVFVSDLLPFVQGPESRLGVGINFGFRMLIILVFTMPVLLVMWYVASWLALSTGQRLLWGVASLLFLSPALFGRVRLSRYVFLSVGLLIWFGLGVLIKWGVPHFQFVSSLPVNGFHREFVLAWMMANTVVFAVMTARWARGLRPLRIVVSLLAFPLFTLGLNLVEPALFEGAVWHVLGVLAALVWLGFLLHLSMLYQLQQGFVSLQLRKRSVRRFLIGVVAYIGLAWFVYAGLGIVGLTLTVVVVFAPCFLFMFLLALFMR